MALISPQALFLASIVALLITFPGGAEGGFFHKRAYVTVINYLRPDLPLTLHCKSKHADLGVQQLVYGRNFSFDFNPDWRDVALFFCGFQWKYSTLEYFDIYDGVRDRLKCRCSKYVWRIMADGPCMFNYWTNKYDFCYKWNNVSAVGLPN